MSEKDIWDQAGDSTDDAGSDGLPEKASTDSFEGRESVLEAESVTTVKRKKNPAILVAIILVGVGMFGGVGYVGFQLYSKLFPTVAEKNSSYSTPAIGAGSTTSLESTGGVPVGKSADGLSGMPASDASSATPAEPAASSPFAPASSSQPIGQASTGPISVANVAQAVVAASAPTSLTPNLASTSLDATKLAQCTADCAAKTAQLEEENSRLLAELNALKAPKPAKTASPKKASASKVKVKKAAVAPKVEKPVENVITESGTIADYKIMSIHPKTGAFQKAWVQDGKGRLTIVGVGDRLAGARVLSVDYGMYEVETTKGRVK